MESKDIESNQLRRPKVIKKVERVSAWKGITLVRETWWHRSNGTVYKMVREVTVIKSLKRRKVTLPGRVPRGRGRGRGKRKGWTDVIRRNFTKKVTTYWP